MIYQVYTEFRSPATDEVIDIDFVEEYETEEEAKTEAIRLNGNLFPCKRFGRTVFPSYCIRWSNDSDTEFGYIDADELMPEDEDDTFLEYFCGEEEK